MSDFIQYDKSELIVGGVNITEAIKSDKKIQFNESYTIAGEKVSASSIYACYNLTVIGDLEVEEIEVKGNLYVLGNIKTKRLSCLQTIICSGNIEAETVYGSEVFANDIVCSKISCNGNIISRTTIDSGDSLESNKCIIAGEGILGNGLLVAKNTIAVEYFDFNGGVSGKVIELDTDKTFGESHIVPTEKESLETVISKLQSLISEELQRKGEVDEYHMIGLVNQLSETDISMLSDWKKLARDLVNLSYKNRIENLRDYLIVVMATKILPKEIVEYETLTHVFDNLLIEAEKELDILPFYAENVEDFAFALKIVSYCSDDLKIDKDKILDSIFQSIGIKYKTVESFLKRH